MKRISKNIWKDPVWSKVISAAIIGAYVLIFTTLKSMYDSSTLYSSFIALITLQIPLWLILFLLSSIAGIIYGLYRLSKKSFNYTEEHKALDRTLFTRIREEILPANGSINFIRTNNFGGFTFNNHSIEDFMEFYQHLQPDFEFLDNDMNQILTELKSNISKFTGAIAQYTFPLHGGDVNMFSVPQEWKIENPKRFYDAVEEIHNAAAKVCESYDQLVRIGRRKIGI